MTEEQERKQYTVNCEYCEKGNRPLDQTCMNCLSGKKSAYKKRSKPWPIRELPHMKR